jgi:hypothetical protein
MRSVKNLTVFAIQDRRVVSNFGVRPRPGQRAQNPLDSLRIPPMISARVAGAVCA